LIRPGDEIQNQRAGTGVSESARFHLAIDAIGAKYGGAASELLRILRAIVAEPEFDRISIFVTPKYRRLFELHDSDKLVIVEKPWIDRNSVARLIWYELLLALECRRRKVDLLLLLCNFGQAGFRTRHVTYIQQSQPFSSESLNLYGISYNRLKMFIMKMMMKQSCRKASAVICQNNLMKENLVSTFTLNPNRVKVIYPIPREFAALEFLEKPSTKSLQCHGKPQILYVGSEALYKNLDIVIRGFLTLRERFPELEFVLTLPYCHRISSIPGARCVGYLNDAELVDAYARTNLLVFPSLTETAALPVIEAMSLGVPVLVADRPYAHDICENAAMFFDPLNHEDFSAKAIELLTNETLKKELVQAGLILIEKRRSLNPGQLFVNELIRVLSESSLQDDSKRSV